MQRRRRRRLIKTDLLKIPHWFRSHLLSYAVKLTFTHLICAIIVIFVDHWHDCMASLS